MLSGGKCWIDVLGRGYCISAKLFAASVAMDLLNVELKHSTGNIYYLRHSNVQRAFTSLFCEVIFIIL